MKAKGKPVDPFGRGAKGNPVDPGERQPRGPETPLLYHRQIPKRRCSGQGARRP